MMVKLRPHGMRFRLENARSARSDWQSNASSCCTVARCLSATADVGDEVLLEGQSAQLFTPL